MKQVFWGTSGHNPGEMPINDPAIIDRYYEALLNRETSYAGIFFAGVTTTSVFCTSTCRARKPLKKNVIFFSSIKEALDEGFRPCKICRPTAHAGQAPQEVLDALNLLQEHPLQKLKDQHLRDHGISPETVRRWFQRNHGVSFHAYQRMCRINRAFQEIQDGRDVSAAALDAGYESLSGFGYAYKQLVGRSPSLSNGQELIMMDRLTTPLGPMFVCATDNGVCLLEFVDRKMLETEFGDLQKRLNAKIIAGENHHIRKVKMQLAEYFSGDRKSFDIALDTPGTDFQQKVWNALLDIPPGETRSYKQVAGALGSEDAVRAVAAANGANRVAIIIPCHRVIGSDGSLTGYAGGLERKKWLLIHERKMLATPEGLLF